MKLAEVRNDYYGFTSKASDVARQLAFAGIAVVWIFKAGDTAHPSIPGALLPPLLSFGVALGLDLLQYAFASAIWGIFSWRKERWIERHSATKDEEFQAPECLNWPALIFFWGKIAAAAIGHALLIAHIAKTWGLLR